MTEGPYRGSFKIKKGFVFKNIKYAEDVYDVFELNKLEKLSDHELRMLLLRVLKVDRRYDLSAYIDVLRDEISSRRTRTISTISLVISAVALIFTALTYHWK